MNNRPPAFFQAPPPDVSVPPPLHLPAPSSAELLGRLGTAAALTMGGTMGLKPQAPRPLVLYERTVVLVATYVADFVYREAGKSEMIVVDVKGMRTPVYRLKRKLMLACHGIDVLEVEA
jgi:hypothetical protein